MGSSIKINSISIDLAGAANEIDMVKCDRFSLRGFVAETRDRDPIKCWPFSEESFSLWEKKKYTLPSLSVPKPRWWRSCIRDTDADGPKDCGQHTFSTTRSERKLEIGSSSAIPDHSKMNTLAIVAGNAVEENANVNRDRSQIDDQRASTSLHPPSMNVSAIRSKNMTLTIREHHDKERSQDKVNTTDLSTRKGKRIVDQAVSSEIAGVVEDTPPKATKGGRVPPFECDNEPSESINPEMSGSQPRKTRKSRLLSDLIGEAKTKTSGGGGGVGNNTTKEASSSKSEPARGRKRKMLPQASRKLSTTGATSDQGGDQGESTDSGVEKDPIKGKQRNKRFQVDDEFVPPLPPPETSQEGTRENDAVPVESALSSPVRPLVPFPPSKQRTKRNLSSGKKKSNKPVADNVKSAIVSSSNGTDEGNQVKPLTGPSTNAVSQPTQALFNEDDDNRLASEGYVRKCNPQLTDRPDNDHGSSSKSNTGEGWLRTEADVAGFNSNNNDNTEVADRSCVLKKDDASGADRKGKKIMVQEHEEAPISQRQDTNVNTREEREIAEVMTNDLGRSLPYKEDDVINKQQSQETTPPKSKNALLIDLNETYDNGMISLEDNNNNDNNTWRQPKPVDSNNNDTRKEEQRFVIGNQPRSLDFFALPKHNAPSPFGIFRPPTQDNRAISSYNSIRFSGGHNSQWLGNVPTMANHQSPYPSSFPVSRGCNNTYQSAPHQYIEAPAPLAVWPASMIPPPPHGQHHHLRPVPFKMNQAANLDMYSQALSSSENRWSLNNFVASNGKQKCGSSNQDFSFGYNHGAAGIHGGRSIDGAFANESPMPTYRLFSVTDPVRSSNIPGDHHGSSNHFSRRHFPPVNQTGDSSKTGPPFHLYSTRFSPEISQRTFPVVRPLAPSSFSIITEQDPWSIRQPKKARVNERTAAVVTPSSKEKERFQILGESNSMRLPFKCHMAADKEKKMKGKAVSFSDVEAAMRDSSGAIVCSVSRNPADFTVPEPGNVYMLNGEDLEAGDMLPGEELMVPKRATYKRRRASLCKQGKKPAGPVTDNA